MVERPDFSRQLARWLAVGLGISLLALVFVPWRQSVYGYGRVIALDPLDRETPVESPIYGRVDEWFVSEGSKVREGDLIARISDNDSEFLAALRAQKEAAEAKLATAEEEVKLYQKVVEQNKTGLERSLEAADSNIAAAEAKVDAFTQEQQAIAANLKFLDQQKETYSRLEQKMLAAGLTVLEYQQKFLETSAKLAKAKADIAAAQSDLAAKTAYRAETEAKLTAEIRKAEAEIQKAFGKVAEANKELQDIGVKIRRQETQEVRAPRSGTIFRLLANKQITQLKDGDPIAILIPDAQQLAVELYLDGNDVPLVRERDSVRLQFEGWPAVQFVGWPSAAVGTFGGHVILIDQTETKGKFRIVAIPDPAEAGDPVTRWPGERFLRQGVRAKGWVLLREVPLWWEVWRRVNGFPITVAEAEPWAKDASGDKKDKGLESNPAVDDKDKEKTKIKLPK
jgi:multidrug efflux pump subunit AcrA (membrane-fusion protein)